MKVGNLYKILYPHQKIRIINYITNLDTGVCDKYDDKVVECIHHEIDKISICGDVLRIEVKDNG